MTSPVGKFAALEQRVANLEAIVAQLVHGMPIAAAVSPASASTTVRKGGGGTQVADDPTRQALMAELKRLAEWPQHPSNGVST